MKTKNLKRKQKAQSGGSLKPVGSEMCEYIELQLRAFCGSPATPRGTMSGNAYCKMYATRIHTNGIENVIPLPNNELRRAGNLINDKHTGETPRRLK